MYSKLPKQLTEPLGLALRVFTFGETSHALQRTCHIIRNQAF
jgi:hypothetical protein